MRRRPRSFRAMAETIKVDPVNPDPAVIIRAAEILHKGGLVVFPTLGLYGLGADAMNSKAVLRVFAAKGRAPEKPVLILVRGANEAEGLALELPRGARGLMEAFWPGRLTIILPASEKLPEALCAGTGTVGIRAAGHPVARAIISAFGGAVTGTSANVADEPAPASIGELSAKIAESADLIIDAGRLSGEPSTVVSAASGKIEILRPGAISEKRIFEALGLAGRR